MSLQAFIFFKNMHTATLASSTLQSLKEKVIEIINKTTTCTPTPSFKITDNNGQDIDNDQKVQATFGMQPVFFLVHLIDNSDNDEKKNVENEKINDGNCHKIVQPLILLTGAAKYENSDYLPGVKADLINFKVLFEAYGYQVHSTYDQNKPETELLTLKQLNLFLMKHYIKLLKNKNNYDALIFVWCGHGSIAAEGDTLVTSDDHNCKLFKKIQELFTDDTDMFLNKPKIFIKNACRVNDEVQQLYNRESDTLCIFSTTPGKFIIDSPDSGKGKGSYFADAFVMLCQKILTHPSHYMTIYNQLLEIIQTASTCDRHIFLNNNKFQKKALKEKVKMEKYDQSTKNKVNTEVVLLSHEKYCFNKDWILQLQEEKEIAHLICLVCKQIANNALQLTCSQHEKTKETLIIGENCLKLFLEKNKYCPILSHEDCSYSSNRVARHLIDNLQVMCIRQFEQDLKTPNKTESNDSVIKCNFIGPLKYLHGHLNNECTWKSIDCCFKSFGCNHSCFIHNLKDHLNTNMQKHICLVCKYMKEDSQLKTEENIEKYNNVKKEFSSYQEQVEMLKNEFNNSKKQMQLAQQEVINSLKQQNTKLNEDYQKLLQK
ncbi:hypothetical protein RFI_05622, partial [Reticulomyxa filosa]